MVKKRIISIAGKPGSGKSTASKKLAKRLNFTHYSSGELFRTLAKEHGIKLYEINILAETKKEIDHQVDTWLQTIGKEEDNFVVDSRMAWHWMPYSFRVYLDLDLDIAAKRILQDMDPLRREAEHIPADSKAYAEQLADRLASESKRYLALYNQNPSDLSNYDLVVDTNIYNSDEVVTIIGDSFEKWHTK